MSAPVGTRFLLSEDRSAALRPPDASDEPPRVIIAGFGRVGGRVRRKARLTARRVSRDVHAPRRGLVGHVVLAGHARAPEAALSIANCQIELKDTRTARKTLEDLVRAYPQSEAAVAAKERLSRLK